ncbi:hypothetical protein ACES2L_02045 [Bdellovibrio bacteriovorus]
MTVVELNQTNLFKETQIKRLQCGLEQFEFILNQQNYYLSLEDTEYFFSIGHEIFDQLLLERRPKDEKLEALSEKFIKTLLRMNERFLESRENRYK